ncbi:MAG TPA: class I SAM-dependent methyltransferase [Chitinophagaceae bacterium]|jgi:ubiquinone/menaquinone biosynthesis C-methylase UbiE
MNNRQAYNTWARNYDAVINKTRDLEAFALRETLSRIELSRAKVLEIGCGTGKNTIWLSTRAQHIVGVDFAEEMLHEAKKKIITKNVEFYQFDIKEKWVFSEEQFDLVICSLILEHIENIDFVFKQANLVLKRNGLFYVGELHPFKQYQGSKARFDTDKGVFELNCFVHNISDFFEAGKNNNFECIDIKEWFDNDDKTTIPRLLMMLFRKK